MDESNKETVLMDPNDIADFVDMVLSCDSPESLEALEEGFLEE